MTAEQAKKFRALKELIAAPPLEPGAEKLTVAWPLLASALTPAGTFHVYFGVGLQF